MGGSPVTAARTVPDLRIGEVVPEVLLAVPQWVCWRYEERKGKKTKVPINPRTGERASSKDPDDWVAFDVALAAFEGRPDAEGLGFVFSRGDPFCGVDLDDCQNAASGKMASWAHEIVKNLDSYAEISPSGCGVKIFLKGRKPGPRCRKAFESGEIEIYDQGRFFTVTGRRLSTASANVEDRQEELDELYAQTFGRQPDISGIVGEDAVVNDAEPAPALDDDEIIEKASGEKKGEKFQALWNGDWNKYFNSPSEADGSIVCKLAFYTKDAEQIDRIFRRSGLMRPKWDEMRGGATYGQKTIASALDIVPEQYRPRRVKKTSNKAGTDQEEDSLVPLGTRDPDTNQLVISSRRTLPTAVAFMREFCTHREGPTLLDYAAIFMRWKGNRFAEVEDGGLRKELFPWLHEAVTYKKNPRTGELELVPFEANPSTVNSALESLRACCHVPASLTPPVWLNGGKDKPNPLEVLSCRSEGLHIPTGKILPATPALFNINALDFDYDPDAPTPGLWLEFLDELWGDDTGAIELLQEWIGYCLTADTSQQKMLMLVGPKRSGKGTIARVLARLVGTANVCGPTVSSLAGEFGLQPLIGKSLGIVSDARFKGKDLGTVVERLLCISGEDTLTVNRKHLPAVTLKLPTRLMFLSNELPKLQETSGALAGRFLILMLTQSFFGREDRQLTVRLCTELPGILLWALAGWKRLAERGYFLQPDSAEDAIRELEDLSSPVGAFVRQRCAVGPNYRVWADDLYEAWKAWCDTEGWRKASTNASFGRDLFAAVPGLVRRRSTDDRRFYQGIELKEILL